MRALTIILLFVSILSYSQFVSEDLAKTVASNYYLKKTSKFSNFAIRKIQFHETTIITNSNNDILFYIFDLKNTGYIITSANKNIVPVLAYSTQSNFSFSNIPPAVNFWLNRYKVQTDYIIANKIILKNNINLWDKWLNNNLIPKNITDTLIEPLVTSQWNQTKYYNSLCPADSVGPDGHTLTGCVATAAGQLLNYHRFPSSGIGSYTYDCPGYGTISEDFSTGSYNYDEMADVLSGYSNSAAQMLYHLGVSFNMYYGPDGSAVWNHSVDNSLQTYFKYCPETEYLFRDSTTLNWDSIVAVNLMNRKPLYYAGWEDLSFQSGHAFVCDGYNGANYYHYNWGWGGAYDGWFYSDNLTPGGAQFSYAQEIIKDIYPDTLNYTYPNYCSLSNVLNTSFASITDGSGALNYTNNMQCGWYINPTCGKILNIEFDKFDVLQNDTLYVYDGNNNETELLSYFTYGEEPILSTSNNNTKIQIIDGDAFVEFLTDDSVNADGWKLSYTSEYCKYGLTITDTVGTVSDGSETCNYNESQSCKWTIEPDSAEAIKINFTQFALDPNNTNDYVKVYKNSTSSSNLIAELRSSDSPSEIYVPSGKVIIKFSTYTNSSGEGWEFNFEKTTLASISINSFNIYHKIYPNPVSNFSTIEFVTNTPDKAKLTITSVEGKIIGTKMFTTVSGLNSVKLSDITYITKSGVYLIKYVSENNSFIDKIIVE